MERRRRTREAGERMGEDEGREERRPGAKIAGRWRVEEGSRVEGGVRKGIDRGWMEVGEGTMVGWWRVEGEKRGGYRERAKRR